MRFLGRVQLVAAWLAEPCAVRRTTLRLESRYPLCRFRWVAWRPECLGWWGSCLRMCGASSMGTASIVNFINQTCHVAMSAEFIVSDVQHRSCF